MLCSCFFSYSYSVRRGGRYSYSYSMRSKTAIWPIGLQFLANRFVQRSASPQVKQPASTSTSTVALSTSTTKSDAMCDRPPLTVCEKETLHMSKPLDRRLRCNVLFLVLLVLVLSPPWRTVLVLVIELFTCMASTRRPLRPINRRSPSRGSCALSPSAYPLPNSCPSSALTRME